MLGIGDLGASGEAGAEGIGVASRSQLLTIFGAAVVASIAIGLIPSARMVLYPFSLLATWAHEMGHGIGALITGNSFIELELYRSLGGQALTAGADGWSQVVVSALGLLGPAVLGAVVMIAGSRPTTAPWVLGAVAFSVIGSTLWWVRNGFGFVAMLIIGAALAGAAKFLPPFGRVLLTQFLAVQLALSSWSTRDYLFIDGFERDGWQVSDTGKIADELFLPYWVWGGLIGGLAIVILATAFWKAWLRPLAHTDPEHARHA